MKELYAKIGELTVERDFSARVGELSRSARRAMVERDGALSPSRQCELLDVGRASLYREPAGESGANLALMRRIDELHMDCPFTAAGRCRITCVGRGWWLAGTGSAA